MKITIEVDTKNEIDKLSALLKEFKIDSVNIISDSDINIPLIKGDKSIDPKELFGIWANNPRTIETIRKDGWERN